MEAQWPAGTRDSDRLRDRGVAAVQILAASGTTATPTKIARIALDDVVIDDTAASILVDGRVIQIPATPGSDACPFDLIRRAHDRASRAGSKQLLGWTGSGGELCAADNVGELIRLQLVRAYRRAGIDSAVHPAQLTDAQRSHLIGHVDPSYRLGLRTKALLATAFVTAARHSDLVTVELPLKSDGDRYELFVPNSKADQEAKGHFIYVDHLPDHGGRCPGCHLRRWIDELTDSGPLFPSVATGGQPLRTTATVGHANSALKRLVAATSIDTGVRNVRTHTFRRSHSTIRAEQGEPADVIAADTHQSPDVLWTHYVDPARLHDTQAQIRFD